MTEPKPEYKHGGRRSGAGRKALEEKLGEPVIQITILVTQSQHEYLTARAAAESISVAELLRRLIAQDMERSKSQG